MENSDRRSMGNEKLVRSGHVTPNRRGWVFGAHEPNQIRGLQAETQRRRPRPEFIFGAGCQPTPVFSSTTFAISRNTPPTHLPQQ